jgi:hypothetical protein
MPGSDIDLLAITDGDDRRFDLETYSRYSYARLQELWQEGNPFAWHLSLESKLLFGENDRDFLRDLGAPAPYRRVAADCDKFARLFQAARGAVKAGSNSVVFELSTIFLAARNIATCFSLGCTERPDFSRRSALRLGSDSLAIDQIAFETLERARVLSTRGVGPLLSHHEIQTATACFAELEVWMSGLCAKTRSHERVQ